MLIDTLSQQLINAYQKGFPLCSRPFLLLAEEFNVSETEVLACFSELENNGVLSRLGPVFDHQQAGASTLAAIAASEDKIDEVAEVVNSFANVNHNYKREHDYNLWFVVTAPTEAELSTLIDEIEQATALPVLVLPMLESFHIDLSFKVNFEQAQLKVS